MAKMSPALEEDSSTPSNERRSPPANVKNRWSEEGAENQKNAAPYCSCTSCWSCNDPHLRCSELVQCAVWAHPADGIATRLLARRIVVSCSRFRKTSLSETSASFARSRRLGAGRSAHHCATFCCGRCSSKNICESETSMGSKSSSITVSTDGPSLHHPKTFVFVLRWGPSDRDKQRYVLLAKSCGADLENHLCGVYIEVGPSPSSTHQYLNRSY